MNELPKEGQEPLPLNELPEISTRRIAAEIFTQKLSADIKHIYEERRSVTIVPQNSLATINPKLLELQRQIQADNEPDSDFDPTVATEKYLSYRQRFLSGETDSYGRGGFLLTVPDENDSAALTVLSDLELKDKDLIAEGAAHRVYEARHKPGRFGFTIRKLFADDTLDTDTPVAPGKKIVVPSSPWAGYYAQLFIPDDRSHKFIWAYSHSSRPFDEEFPRTVKNILSGAMGNGRLQDGDFAMLYAVKVCLDHYDKNGDLRNFVRKLTSSIEGVPAPTDDQFDQLLDAIGKYPENFKPNPQMSLDMLRDHFGELRQRHTKPGNVSDDLLIPQLIITSKEALFHDPGLLTWAVTQLVSEEIYPKWREHITKAVKKTLKTAQENQSPTQEELSRHAQTYFHFNSFQRVMIPWQAKFILGEEGYTDFQERIKAIQGDDPNAFVGLEAKLLSKPSRGQADYKDGKDAIADGVEQDLDTYIRWISDMRKKLDQAQKNQ